MKQKEYDPFEITHLTVEYSSQYERDEWRVELNHELHLYLTDEEMLSPVRFQEVVFRKFNLIVNVAVSKDEWLRVLQCARQRSEEGGKQ